MDVAVAAFWPPDPCAKMLVRTPSNENLVGTIELPGMANGVTVTSLLLTDEPLSAMTMPLLLFVWIRMTVLVSAGAGVIFP